MSLQVMESNRQIIPLGMALPVAESSQFGCFKVLRNPNLQASTDTSQYKICAFETGRSSTKDCNIPQFQKVKQYRNLRII